MKFRSLGRKDPLEEKMATHSSILAWIISWTEEPGGLQSMGLQRDMTECVQMLTTGECLNIMILTTKIQ